MTASENANIYGVLRTTGDYHGAATARGRAGSRELENRLVDGEAGARLGVEPGDHAVALGA